MLRWLDRGGADWGVLMGTPLTLAISALALGGILTVAAVYATGWFYNEQLAARDRQIAIKEGQIAVLRERLAAYGQTPAASSEQAVEEVHPAEQLQPPYAELRAQQLPARHADGIYQFGSEVAKGVGANSNKGTISFRMIYSFGNFDASREAEFREFVIQCPGNVAPLAPGMAGSAMAVAPGAECRVLRRRS